jgi:hypothetical protein
MWRLIAGMLLSWQAGVLQAKDLPIESIANGNGTVLFQFSNDFPVLYTGAYAPQISVTRADGDGKTLHYLQGGTPGFRTTQSYLGALPPGRYRFVDFQAVPCKILCPGALLPPPSNLPEFEIAAGRIRYLGTLGLAMLSNGYQTQVADFRKYWSWTHTPAAGESLRMLRAYPAMSAYTDRVDNGWTGTDTATQTGLRWQLKTLSYGMFGASDYGDDGFYFGSHNGMVKRFRPGSAIELMDTGHDFMVTSVRELAPGQLFTTAEAGLLHYSSDHGKTWQDRSAGIDYGIAANAVVLGEDEVAFTLQKGDTVQLYRGAPSTGSWRKIAEFPLVFATWTGLPGAQPELFHHNGTLVLTLPSRKIAVIDLATGTSALRDPPGSISTAKLSADGVLRCACAKSIAISPYESRDYGQTWAPASFSRFLNLPEFHDALNGFSYQGAVFSAKKTGLSFTRDGGKTWDFNNYPDLGQAWWQPSYSRNGKVLLLYSVSNFGTTAFQVLKTSVDGGKSWQPVTRRLGWLYPPGPPPSKYISPAPPEPPTLPAPPPKSG